MKYGKFPLVEKDKSFQNSKRKYAVIVEEAEFRDLKTMMNEDHTYMKTKRAMRPQRHGSWSLSAVKFYLQSKISHKIITSVFYFLETKTE